MRQPPKLPNGKRMTPNKVYDSTRKGKKKMVYATKGDQGKLIHFGDANMSIKKHIPARLKSFRARHKCDSKKDRLTAGYWSCKAW